MKILILVLSHNTGIYNKLYESQKKTWDSIKIDGIETYYYFGNSLEETIIDNNIFTKDVENPKCLHKTISAFRLIKNFEFDFLVRTNSSSYIDKELLFNFLINKPKEKYYAGIVGVHENITFASGACFIISKDVFTLIMNNLDKIDYNLIDDVAFGKLLNEHNTPPNGKDIRRFDFEKNGFNLKNSLDYIHYRSYSGKYNREIEIDFFEQIFKLKSEKNLKNGKM